MILPLPAARVVLLFRVKASLMEILPLLVEILPKSSVLPEASVVKLARGVEAPKSALSCVVLVELRVRL